MAVCNPPALTVTEKDAAAYINYKPSAMKAWRRRGTGPAYIRVGRSVRYRIPDLDAWQSRHRIEPQPNEAEAR